MPPGGFEQPTCDEPKALKLGNWWLTCKEHLKILE